LFLFEQSHRDYFILAKQGSIDLGNNYLPSKNKEAQNRVSIIQTAALKSAKLA